VFVNFVVPFVLLGIKRLRSITTATIASIGVLIGMWLERYLIIIPPLSLPRLAAAAGRYSPSWVEISITVATFASMGAMYLVFSKLFPIVSVWEFEANEQEEE
jgi:molybdopterin-containing oxidoreductase family membrane subunit